MEENYRPGISTQKLMHLWLKHSNTPNTENTQQMAYLTNIFCFILPIISDIIQPIHEIKNGINNLGIQS